MGDEKICVICKDAVTGRIIQYVSCVECKGPVHLSCIPGNKRGKGRIDYLSIILKSMWYMSYFIFQFFQKQLMFLWTRTTMLFTLSVQNALLLCLKSNSWLKPHKWWKMRELRLQKHSNLLYGRYTQAQIKTSIHDQLRIPLTSYYLLQSMEFAFLW